MEFEIKSQNKLNLGLQELWEYRELFYFFTWRDIKVKYKQTVLGFLWAILQPLFMTIVFTIFISDSIVTKTQLSVPYPLFALSGMLLWGVFSGGMSNAANSMVNNANIIKKIYFPRLIIPISSILVALVDFFIAFIIFVIALFYYQIEINYIYLLSLPVCLLMTGITAMGCGTLLAALNIKYRDVRYIIPFLVQGLLFLTPVLYPINITNNAVAQFILKLNPVSGALELMRGIFAGNVVNYEIVWMSFGVSILLFVIGVTYFRKTEAYFADLA
jgi:lipopolysaccharide transport system permease protein